MKLIKNIYLNELFFILIGINVVLFVLGHFITIFFDIAKAFFPLLLVFFIVDVFLLFLAKQGFQATREVPERLSNGDDNTIEIFLQNNYAFAVRVNIIDEIPVQFQRRNVSFKTSIDNGAEKIIKYFLHPVFRGEYEFGITNIYVKSPIGLVSRRYRFGEKKTVPVYPSFLQMRKYELIAFSNRLNEAGLKRIRRVGHSSEFDQIRNYIEGDDYRLINWKATARKANVMVNQYMDERSQQVYNIIDMGRAMKMPFDGMTLLDYAINASLVLSNIIVLKSDKAGLITFSTKINTFLKADRKKTQVHSILELLYNQKTAFLEPNYELLTTTILSRIPQRSLIVLYTNFESMVSMKRYLGYLKSIATRHLLLVIFFENTELKKTIEKHQEKTKDIYIKTIAESYLFEKRQIIRELKGLGIHSIMTAPKNLTVNAINKYLEIKARNLI